MKKILSVIISVFRRPSWFTWHFFPSSSEHSIKSIAETLIYLILFAFLGFLFIRWNTVEVHHETIELECIDYPQPDSIFLYIAPTATVAYRCPMTFTDFNKDINTVEKGDFAGSKVSFGMWIELNGNCNYTDSIYAAATDKFWSWHMKYWHPGSGEKEKKDSLRQIFQQLYPNELGESHRYPLYYFSGTSSFSNEFVRSIPDEVKIDTSDGKYLWTRMRGIQSSPKQWRITSFISGIRWLTSTSSNLGKYTSGSYERPTWYALEDITQKYYDFHLISATIDSVQLKFDFVGATDFSLIQPEPDVITMSSIEFTNPDKIFEIKRRGLQFYAEFKELKNLQTIRMFAVTTILGGMFLIFLAMIVIAGLKLIRWGQRKHI